MRPTLVFLIPCLLRPCLALQIKPIFGLTFFICKKVPHYLYSKFPKLYFGPKSLQFMTFKPLFRPITKLSLSFVTFRVSRFHVSYLTHETFKLSLQNTLNMSKTARVYFGMLQRKCQTAWSRKSGIKKTPNDF